MGLEADRARLIECLRQEISDKRVLAAMADIPRELFVSSDCYGSAYEDRPLSIGFGQTISQPFIVALMTQALELKGNEKVLEMTHALDHALTLPGGRKALEKTYGKEEKQRNKAEKNKTK